MGRVKRNQRMNRPVGSCLVQRSTIPNLFSSISAWFLILGHLAIAGRAQDRPDFVNQISARGLTHLQRLIELAEVRFEFNDEKLAAANRTALTLFELQASFQTEFDYERTGNQGKGSEIAVRVQYARTKLSIRHALVLPTSFDLDDKQMTELLKHEFDHVAISSDPRLTRLAMRLFFQPDRFRVDVAADESADAVIGRETQARFDARKVAFERWGQKLYDELDEVSKNGIDVIANRQEFFTGMYEKSELSEFFGNDWKRIEPVLREPAFRKPYGHFELLTLP